MSNFTNTPSPSNHTPMDVTQKQRLQEIGRILRMDGVPDAIRKDLFEEGRRLWVATSTPAESDEDVRDTVFAGRHGTSPTWARWGSRCRQLSHERMVAHVQAHPDEHTRYLDSLQEARAQWEWDSLEVFANRLQSLPAGAVVADVGCGQGHLATRLMAQRSDLTVRSFDLVKTAPHVEVADAVDLPLDGRSLDAVVMSNSLWGDKALQLAEGHRVLKDGGLLLVADPESHWMDGELDELLADAGFAFTPVKSDPVGRFVYTLAVKTAVL